MREIEFRGVDKYSKKWVHGAYINDSHILPRSDRLTIAGIIVDEAEEVIPGTIGQFTDLRDKNNIKGYEGDIFETPYNDTYDFARFLIRFEDGAFTGECVALHQKEKGFKNITRGGYCDIHHLTQGYFSNCVIIGNNHENPELINLKGDFDDTKRGFIITKE